LFHDLAGEGDVRTEVELNVHKLIIKIVSLYLCAIV
jgi:hypothetical protein